MKYVKLSVLILLISLNVIFNADAVETILRVAFDPNLPPFQFIEDGKACGIHIDLLNSIAEDNDFIIKYIPMAGIDNCIEALQNNKADIILGLKNINKYKDVIYTTESISQSYLCILANKRDALEMPEILNVMNISAVLEIDSIKYSYIQNMRNVNYIVKSDQVQALNFFMNNDENILVGVRHSVLYQLEKMNRLKDYTIINNYLAPIEYTIGVKYGDDELTNKINEGIRKIRINGSYENMYNKWINEDDYKFKKRIEHILNIAFVVLALIAAAFLVNIRLNRLLKRQVDEKTTELVKTNSNLEKQIIATQNANELRNCIVENSPSGIVVFDNNCLITLFNKNAAYIVGEEELLIGRNINEIYLLQKIIGDKIEFVLSKGVKYINEEIAIKNENDAAIVYRYDIYNLHNPDKKIRGAIIDIKDVTKEVKVKEEMYEREKNKALNQIIAGIAHEIRNPLMSIKTFIELIPIKKGNENFQNQLEEFVPKEVDRVSNLIKSLIDYAKPSVLRNDYINVVELLNSCTMLIQPVLKNNRMILETEIEKDLFIYSDRDKMKQIVMNIILNAYESMQEKIKVQKITNVKLKLDIKAWQNSNFLIIEVKDEGVGMTKSEIEKSTQLFFTTKQNGTGIGLPLSKQYLEENGGMLSIESEKNIYTKITLKFRR